MLTRKIFSSSVAPAVAIKNSHKFLIAPSTTCCSSVALPCGLFKKSQLLLSIGNIPEHGSRPSGQKLDHEHQHSSTSVAEEASTHHEEKNIDESLAELELQHQQQDGGANKNNNNNSDDHDQVSTQVGGEETGEESGASFDVVEATLQEVHDLLVAMVTHKHNTTMREPVQNRYFARRNDDRGPYSRFQMWEAGHKHFVEWMDKLEKLLTPEIMQAMISSADASERHPSQKVNVKNQLKGSSSNTNDDERTEYQEMLSNPDNFQGFAKHPLSYSAATGAEWKLPKETEHHLERVLTQRQLNSGVRTNFTPVMKKKKQLTSIATKFFMHGPYQLQISRPDASDALMEQARSYRDFDSMIRLSQIVQETDSHWYRQLPTQDRLKLIKIVSDALEYGKIEEEK